MSIYELFGSRFQALKNVKAVISDFDGTLVDSMRFWHAIEGEGITELDGMAGYMKDKYDNVITPKPGAEAFLKTLKKQGVPVCIATDTPLYLSSGFFKRCGMLEYVDFYIGSDDAGGFKSVSPAVYRLAAKRFGLSPEECLVLEDYLTSARTAKRAGFTVVGVRDGESLRDEAALRSLCDGYIGSFDELAL